MGVLVLLMLCVTPPLAVWGLMRVTDWLSASEPSGGRRHRPDDTVLPALGADLRRLSAEADNLLKSDVPGRALRLRAVQLAYDDTLLRAGAVLDVDLPEPPLLSVTRLQAEAELTARGFTW